MTKTRSRVLIQNLSALLLFMLLLGAVAVRAEEKSTTDPPQSKSRFPTATPESQGLSSSALKKLANIVQGYFEKDLIVGAELLVIKNRHTVLHEVSGWRDREQETPMTRNTIFNIRSMTKPLTGAAIQILIDRGDLELGDRASETISGFENANSKDITIEQLLTHRSGLPLTVFSTGPRQYSDLQTIANTAGTQGPQFPPSSKFWYSDAGSDVLGAIVEQTSGVPLADFWSRHLLEPLGMHDTFVAIDKTKELRWDRLASLYLRGGPPDKRAWFPYWKPAGPPLYPFAWGSQTLYSTPMDYARFLAMWMDDGMVGDRQILSSNAIKRTLSPTSTMTSLGSDKPYPTGFPELDPHYGQMSILYMAPGAPKDAKPEVIGHSGSDGTWAWAWPELDLMVLYFTQSRGQSMGVALEFRIDQLLVHPESSQTEREAAANDNPAFTKIKGEWEGRIIVDETRGLDVLWRFELSDSREIVGFMGPASRGIATIPMQNIVISESGLSFEVNSQGGRYQGTVSENKIVGTWLQRGASRSLNMAKVDLGE